MKRLLIFGTGHCAARNVSAARRFLDCDEIVAFSPRAESRAAFHRRFPEVELFSTSREMLGASDPAGELIVIATPPYLHYAHAAEALDSGRPVLVEKPFATTLQDAAAMVAKAEARGLPLGCCSGRYASRPVFSAVKDVLARDFIGQPFRIDWRIRRKRVRPGVDYQQKSTWFLDRLQAGGGCLMDFGPYDISCLLNLLDPIRVEVTHAWIGSFPRDVAPSALEKAGENLVVAGLVFWLPGGGRVPVTYERSDSGYAPEIHRPVIESATCAVSWDWLDWQGGSIRIVTNHRGADAHEKISVPDPYWRQDLARPLDLFARQLNGGAVAPDGGTRALDVMAVIAAIYAVAESSRPQTIETNQPSGHPRTSSSESS